LARFISATLAQGIKRILQRTPRELRGKSIDEREKQHFSSKSDPTGAPTSIIGMNFFGGV
jgi:hypothetical protein